MLYSAVHVSALIDAVQRTGFVQCDDIALADLPVDATGSVGAAEFEDLLELCLAKSTSPALGLAMGEHASLVTLGLNRPPLLYRPSLRVMVETFIARYTVAVDTLSPELSVTDDEARLSFPVYGTSEATRRLRAEYGATLGLLLLRTWGGPFATPRWLSFPHREPSYLGEYRRLFGTATRFGAERAAIAFSASLLRAPAYSWRHQLLRQNTRHATHAMELERIDERVRRLLTSGSSLVSERPDIAEVAAHLSLTERGLRRRLAAAGACFRELQADALRERALSLMLDPTNSLESVTTMLGFSQSSAFHRAFKRWTGFTPMQYRIVHMGDEGGVDEEPTRVAMRYGVYEPP